MRARVPLSLALVLAAGLAAVPVFAEDLGLKLGGMGGMSGMSGMSGAPHQRWIVFGLGGGVAVPVSDAKDALKNGFNGLAYARAQLPGFPISFGVNAAFQRFDLKDTKVSAGGGSTATASPGSTDVIGGLGDLKMDLIRGPIRPYITAGIGVYHLKTTMDATASTPENAASQTHFGINGGAGIALRFGAISGYIQGRVDNVYTDTGGVIDTKSIQVIPVTAGIEF